MGGKSLPVGRKPLDGEAYPAERIERGHTLCRATPAAWLFKDCQGHGRGQNPKREEKIVEVFGGEVWLLLAILRGSW